MHDAGKHPTADKSARAARWGGFDRFVTWDPVVQTRPFNGSI
ncbi:hypothetical protein MES5069_1610002 [Mesorhizobium escarrei]|uniref:Uncharacterized protein n=1 Tax=Mesorhizobium escarrei TaxID=666018 RepID=A0ABM9DKF9_9HYPH|nr:hypothetical protein MES5069_1610002 [Mesorhizobium escarrei]